MSQLAWFLIFPLVGALVGWFTNWLAILMLFRPRQPIRVLWWSLQGVIPRRHYQFADRIAETVEKSLLTREDLDKAMSGVGWHEEISRLIRDVLHDRGPGGIIEQIPGVAQIWKNIVLPSLQEVLSREVIRFVEGYRSGFVDRLRDSVDVREIVRSRVEQFEIETLENLVMSVARREFGHIQVVGAITGALIGVIQGLILLLAG
ncbi:MAG: DUF445 family protein [bacterium]|nr:DUF445 family protein [bacterium]MDT8395536.1 DUF445 family protein [bacterium]